MGRVFSKRDARLRSEPAKPNRPPRQEQREPDTKCRLCRREFGDYSMPDEAFVLYTDIERLDLIIDLVSELDTRTINDGNDSGVTVRRLHFILSSMRTQAQQLLVRQFLCGKPLPKRKKTQTMADVWKLMLDSLRDQEQPNESPKRITHGP